VEEQSPCLNSNSDKAPHQPTCIGKSLFTRTLYKHFRNTLLKREIVAGKDFVKIKTGPFDVDLVFAPNGIASFEEARSRRVTEGIFEVANLRDIIASKRAGGRQKDQAELPLLESFRGEYEKRHAPPARSAVDIAARRTTGG